ncbi:putative GATA transcription factor 22 [Cornus florida]|uniref:putative GATA transcription factor 22 n=1 Tax=Cornus florida TaxID=4283 RepID=UPI0028A1E73A|nr:putative GATA transcription factor 22 [Cornus florida]
MTPAYLNPSSSPSSSSPLSFVELKEDQLLQFYSPSHQPSSSFSCPIFFKVAQDQRGSQAIEPRQDQQKADDKYMLHEGPSDHQVLPSTSVQTTVPDDNCTKFEGNKLPNYYKLEDENEKDIDDVSAKWMSSKMRLMQKMMDTSRAGMDQEERIVQKFHDRNNNETTHQYPNNINNIVRVCSDCHTTKTPLWRSGPQGPKTLCNACGIRQRKARRAMAAAAAAAAAGNGTNLATNSTTARSTKVQSKEKKSRKSYITQYKKQLKLRHSQSEKKLSFEDFALSLIQNSAFGGVFPKDEEEAAVLLMALSCGLINS